jgi:hypothetical protein
MLRRAGRAVATSPFTQVALLALLAGAGCKGSHGNLGALRDALSRGDAVSIGSATRDAPTCGTVDPARGAPSACLGEIAAWLGSKTGFQVSPPDQAAAATAALVIARDGHGEWFVAPDAWIAALRTGQGAGADTLRLAMAAAIGEKAGPLARSLESDDDARALLRAVASSVPGACETYARLGAGDDVTAGPPERTADHSACVQKDLERASGPAEHGAYGAGLWRAAEGALALWRDAAKALHEGAAREDVEVRGALEASLARMDAALGRTGTKKLPPSAPAYVMGTGDVHQDVPGALDAGALRAMTPLLPSPTSARPAPKR